MNWQEDLRRVAKRGLEYADEYRAFHYPNEPERRPSGKIPPAGTKPTREQMRRITGDDLDGWLDAASKREPPRKRDRETLRSYLKGRNPWRWKQLQRHLRWAEKEMLRLGMNPEDTRWIL